MAQANTLLHARQRELELANERFRMAAETAEEAIWELDLQNQTAFWSDLYTKSFGRRPAESSIEWWFDHIHQDDRDRVRAGFSSALLGSAVSWACEYRMLRADGLWAHIYDRAAINRNAEGKALRVIGAMLDVTEIKRVNEELERRTQELARSNDDLQRFAFGVSHDLQAPLRMIGDYGQNLAKANMDEESRRLVRCMIDSVARMRTIIQDMLEFARISSQPAAPGFRTDSNTILDLALQHLGPKLRETGAEVTADRLPIVMANDTGLLRVFQNVIGNALKYCERQPQIHISATRDADMCLFSIKDNGIGIAPEYHKRIFGLFERLHGRDRYSGTGIGLAIVKRIIESQNGQVWLKSALGNGSTIYFSLRAADTADAHKA